MKKNPTFKEALKECRKVFGEGVWLEFTQRNTLIGVKTLWTISDGYNTPMDAPGKNWTVGSAETFGAALWKAKRKGRSQASRSEEFHMRVQELDNLFQHGVQ